MSRIKERRHTTYIIVAAVGLLALVVGPLFTVSEEHGPDELQSEDKFTFFAPSDSNAATIGQPFVINGKNDTIVGQITKLPAEGEEIKSIKPTSNLDNQANRDLLSVVNKH